MTKFKGFVAKVKKLHVDGMALFPFILLKHKPNKRILNHERIHLQQQLELAVIPFYILYLLEYLFRLIQYRNHLLAYFNISFEREAYENERNLNYLQERKPYAFRTYFQLKRRKPR